ncbi:MAG TPA: hypothetical protein VGF60_00880, partial [Xanthobacteraceae bacterium]
MTVLCGWRRAAGDPRYRRGNEVILQLMSELDSASPRRPGLAAGLPPGPEKPLPFHHGLIGRLRNYFLTGLILVGPLYITVSL